MKSKDFNALVSNYCLGKGIRFTDELIGLYESRYEDYKYFFVYTSNGNIHQAFNSKKEVIEFIKSNKVE